ncbi:hypothetical protein KO519_21110 [Paraglaciecola agarilytica]|uniref:hypothetical protein n=1 Tax=Paraglaciecola chathamensis TaxID=368405 RepID=UPI001C092E6B|nr:hypothetical protein [Paraglaciecola agarilytica]MBU3020178.1 hypothetical protein [Paraglaciecola agarilytica]
MKNLLYLSACFFLVSGCAKSPGSSFVYYQSSVPTSCNLVVGLSQEDSQFEYKVTTDTRTATGNFVKSGQQVTFSELYASESVENSKIEVSGLIKGDTLVIQNFGNGMNPFTLFSECDDKYLSLVRVRT